VHFDIEPASLPEWSTNFTAITNEYLDLLQNISINKGPLIDLVADTSIVFNFVNVTRNGINKPLYQWVLDYVDVAMLMYYRNFYTGPNGNVDLSQPSIEYAAHIGKQAIVGVETNEEDPAEITFYGMNTTYMEYVLQEVSLAFKDESSFSGVAVEDYVGYQELDNTMASGNCINKGLFVWGYTIATNTSDRESYFEFAKSRCVTTTYLDSEYLLNNDNATLASFWNMSQSNKMSLQFLLGNAEWVYSYNHPYVLSLVQAARTFVAALPTTPTAAPSPTPHPASTSTSHSSTFTPSTTSSISTSSTTSMSTSSHASTSSSTSHP
jgi:hypothetical protein